jgi:hypothetical protein
LSDSALSDSALSDSAISGSKSSAWLSHGLAGGSSTPAPKSSSTGGGVSCTAGSSTTSGARRTVRRRPRDGEPELCSVIRISKEIGQPHSRAEKGHLKPVRSLRTRCQKQVSNETETTRQRPRGPAPRVRSGNREFEPRRRTAAADAAHAGGGTGPMTFAPKGQCKKVARERSKSSLFPRAGSSRVSPQTPRSRPNTLVGGPLGFAYFVVRQSTASFRRRRQATPCRRQRHGKTRFFPHREAAHAAARESQLPGNRPDRIRWIAANRVCRLSQLCPTASNQRPMLRQTRNQIASRQRFKAALVRQCGAGPVCFSGELCRT